MTFAEAVRQYEKKCAECGVPEETVMAFLVEIAQTERYNLYLHYDEEMPEDLAAKFSAGRMRPPSTPMHDPVIWSGRRRSQRWSRPLSRGP